MRLAAIYIEEHEYLFNKPQTINFGGQYYYEFENVEEQITIKRILNEKYIPNFFQLTDTHSKVTNLNAIVGQNGAGKSTILDIIRSQFIQHEYALPQSRSIFLAEIDEGKPVILRNDFEKVKLIETSQTANKTIDISQINRTKIQTIYYSPHYDYKFNPNFDNIDNHDISFDKILEEDLEELREKETNEHGWHYPPSQELLFKNSIRQITFLSSELVRNQIFKDLFEFQEHYEPILHFRGYQIEEREWNTPTQFRRILQTIEDKLESELNDWHTIRKYKSGILTNQVEVSQYILRRNVLKCIISLLYKQIERRNSFLDQGYFPFDEYQATIEQSSALDCFLLFVKHSRTKTKNSKPQYIFSESTITSLLDKINTAIDNVENEDSISNVTLRTTTADAIEILKQQRQFLIELNSYYIKFYSEKNVIPSEDNKRIEEFINYMPFTRRMSSGEGALLNFFSRIYDFLNSNLKELRYRRLSDHYILLLDEADLGFHIQWKKKYVKSLLSTLPYFFDDLENKPSIEIIFTTHDPIALSDLPNSNVLYLQRTDYGTPPKILEFNDVKRPLKTFGANISDLIADSFFIEDSMIGAFVFDKIQEVIKWLNDKNNTENKLYYKSIIRIIDEPIVQRKLAEMYDDKTSDDFELDVIQDQINKLQEIKRKKGA